MSTTTNRIRADLTAAMRSRDRAAVGLLRATLGAIANAESEGIGAGVASVGVWSAEAARRTLTEDDVRAVVAAERAERLAAADALEGVGAPEAATEQREAAAVLGRYLTAD